MVTLWCNHTKAVTMVRYFSFRYKSKSGYGLLEVYKTDFTYPDHVTDVIVLHQCPEGQEDTLRKVNPFVALWYLINLLHSYSAGHSVSNLTIALQHF